MYIMLIIPLYIVLISDSLCSFCRNDMASGGIYASATASDEAWSSAAGERYKERVWEDLRSLFQQDELTDVMLAAEGQSIPCHRVLLAAASKFFHDKFVVHPESRTGPQSSGHRRY